MGRRDSGGPAGVPGRLRAARGRGPPAPPLREGTISPNLDALRAAVEADPLDPDARSLLAEAFQGRGLDDEATRQRLIADGLRGGGAGVRFRDRVRVRIRRATGLHGRAIRLRLTTTVTPRWGRCAYYGLDVKRFAAWPLDPGAPAASLDVKPGSAVVEHDEADTVVVHLHPEDYTALVKSADR
jgi:hypothetical protein